MNGKLWSAIALAIAQTMARAADTEGVGPSDADEQDVAVEAPVDAAAGASAPVLSSDAANFCFFAGGPPSDIKYQIVGRMKVGKNSYGGVAQLLPRLVDLSRRRGGEAIINYNGSQRFGFFPWRVVRPVVRGEAIRWVEPPTKDCAAMGGSTLQKLLETNSPPG